MCAQGAKRTSDRYVSPVRLRRLWYGFPLLLLLFERRLRYVRTYLDQSERAFRGRAWFNGVRVRVSQLPGARSLARNMAEEEGSGHYGICACIDWGF